MPKPDPIALIDTSSERSVSFAPPDQQVAGARAHQIGLTAPHALRPGRAAIATPTLVGGAPRDSVSGYPIQLGKVRCPPLHDETLARHRLLDWLESKVHCRVIFVVAEAGYGKTTLLADFSRRTRQKTLWYRMDAGDRTWQSFVACIIEAGRLHDPEFAPRTSSLLGNGHAETVSREEVMQEFLTELPAIANDGAVLILDDFHVADDVEEIRSVAKDLVARGPERLAFVFSSRRLPPLPVARLRARGELGELASADLRFSREETDALFRDTYRRSLEPDVLGVLATRTEGWAASLHLVQKALRDRSGPETRAFIRGLSGAQSDLYEYLAEEVVGELPEDHQRFLMRTAILESVTGDHARLVTEQDSDDVDRLLSESVHLGLLAQRGDSRRPRHTYHPLVQQFLESRLRRERGDAFVRDLHRDVANANRASDWRSACFHFGAAGDSGAVHHVIIESIAEIVGSGGAPIAGEYLQRFPAQQNSSAFEIVRSRVAAGHGETDAAVVAARAAVDIDPRSDIALSNLLQTFFVSGDLSGARDIAARLARSARTPGLRNVGIATTHVLDVTLEGSIDDALEALRQVSEESRRGSLTHYEGVSLLNIALLHRAKGRARDALDVAGVAVDLLSEGSSSGAWVAAKLAQAWGNAHIGDLEEARDLLAAARVAAAGESRNEWLAESAEIELAYGSEELAQSYIEEAESHQLNPSLDAVLTLTRVQLLLRRGSPDLAALRLPGSRPDVPTLESGYLSRYLAVRAHVRIASNATDAPAIVAEALALAERQGATLWVGYCRALQAIVDSNIDAALRRLCTESGPVFMSLVAELLLDSMHRMDDYSRALVESEAGVRPERWRASVRRVARDSGNPSRIHAAMILDAIGLPEDVPPLRALAKATRAGRQSADLGKGLARRLAARVCVEDQGRVEIQIGDVVVAGTDLRRKVLAMLCYLLTRPRFSATRDEVVDALWPEMAPEVAGNSLNQTVYFLRRVFEPRYKEDHSAGYVHHDRDVLWLDAHLIQSRSQFCRSIIDSASSPPSPAEVERLSDTYRGRFALDFSYEEWSVPFRDSLHVAYLQVIEGAVSRDIESGHFERAIRLARRALEVDPDLDDLELSLLRLYRVTGAHAAAAEQYAHYAAYLRNELGVEPPPLASL